MLLSMTSSFPREILREKEGIMKRTFLLLLFGLAGALVSAGFAAASPKIKGSSVEYTAQGVVLKGYLAYDQNMKGRRPGILVVHEWWGLNDYARKRARMLAELGYTALAVDCMAKGNRRGILMMRESSPVSS